MPLRLSIILLLLSATSASGQAVIFYNGSADASLATRWEWALDAADEPVYWVGYRIDRMMHPRAFYGMYMHGGINREQSMYAFIGEPEKFDTVLAETHVGWSFRGDGFFQFGVHDEQPQGRVMKEIAVLVRYKNGEPGPAELGVTNMSMEVNFEGVPLYWLDHATNKDSFDHLEALYTNLGKDNVKERAVTAIGIHLDTPGVTAFLTSIVFGNESADVRENAVSWIGRQDTPEALEILQRVIEEDRSLDVREHAVYALSRMTMPKAVDMLIDMARNEKNSELREKAIFGLGQQASKRALDTLDDTIYSEEDTEIQKQAVFALTQFDADVAVPRLIEVANTHPNVKVRKQAIFWLGDTGDERAIEALIEIVERY